MKDSYGFNEFRKMVYYNEKVAGLWSDGYRFYIKLKPDQENDNVIWVASLMENKVTPMLYTDWLIKHSKDCRPSDFNTYMRV